MAQLNSRLTAPPKLVSLWRFAVRQCGCRNQCRLLSDLDEGVRIRESDFNVLSQGVEAEHVAGGFANLASEDRSAVISVHVRITPVTDSIGMTTAFRSRVVRVVAESPPGWAQAFGRSFAVLACLIRSLDGPTERLAGTSARCTLKHRAGQTPNAMMVDENHAGQNGVRLRIAAASVPSSR
jgi:hypothetical protein